MQAQLSKVPTARPAGVARPARAASTGSMRTGSAPRPCAFRPARAARPSTRVRAATDTNQQMQAAEKRWSDQVRTGKVRNVMANEIKALLEDGWVLLDVRPPGEVQAVGIPVAKAVPLFVEDDAWDFGAILKKASNFGMGGWWLGGTHMIANTSFLSDVQAQIPKDGKVIVGCQKGLRSLAACEQLSRAGYPTLAWINGGFDTCRQGDLETTDGKDIRYAGIGGVSALLGWTEVQQEQSKAVLGGAEGFIKVVAAVLVVDLLWLAYEQITYMMSQQ